MSLPVFSGVDREARRAQVEAVSELAGIDFVEVLPPGEPGPSGSPMQRILLVHLLNASVVDEWSPGRVQVIGGVRPDPVINPVRVLWAHPVLTISTADGDPVDPLPPGVTDRDSRLIDEALPRRAAVRDRVLAVRTSSSGDWSTYVVGLFAPDGHSVPAGFDDVLCSAPFLFTVDCPSDLDCCPPQAAPARSGGSPLQDYLARDYEALRGRLIDRLSTLMPAWTDRNPADPAVMLAELFAHLGDRLAYWQDAVAVEAQLGTARRRASVRRHARLLAYPVHEGCSARVWLALATSAPVTLAAGAAVTDLVLPGGGIDAPLLPVQVHDLGGTVFETVADVDLHPARNALALHAWGDPEHVLPTGSTSAFLVSPSSGADPDLRAGDVLILADLPAAGPGNPAGGPVEAGDPARRQAVRLDRDPVPHTDAAVDPPVSVWEVHWHPDDALTTPLIVSEPGPDGRARPRAVALANVVLADHGASVAAEELDPPQATPGRTYNPRLPRDGVAWVDPPLWPSSPRGGVIASGATTLGRPDPATAVAALILDDGRRTWTPRTDLVASSRLDTHVVVEAEPGDGTRVRFGDGITGRLPGTQSTFSARCRLGGGRSGTVGAGRLTTWLPRADGTPPVSGALITVWNPLPANGGSDPQDLREVRRLAPFAYRRQLRAVTPEDHAAVAESVSGVQRSVDRRRWTGSWYTHEVTVDPVATRIDDLSVPAAVADLLEIRRMAGVDVEVARPVDVPLLIEIHVCLHPGYEPGQVELQLLDAFSARALAGGGTGLFHPDRFTFGSPLHVSDLVSAAMGVAGVSWADVVTFARLRDPDPEAATAANLADGAIRVQAREVLRCDSDPNNPEAGRVEFVIGGGR